MHFLAELGLMNYEGMILHSPSKVAASAVYAARCTLNKTPTWNETLALHTGYSEQQLMYVSNTSKFIFLYLEMSVIMFYY